MNWKIILFISFRNYMRQKRRNLLLGAAIAFGVVVLTTANGFSRGIADNILNRIVVYISGHVKINAIESGRIMSPIIRDRERLIKVVQETVPDVVRIDESVGTYGRAVGNSRSEYVFFVGVNFDKEFESQFRLIKGSYERFWNPEPGIIPVMISEQKAKALNVKLYDQIRIRLTNVNGQNETGVLTVACIINSQNRFMDFATFVPLMQMKKLMGYKPWETGALQLVLKAPKSAATVADAIHAKIKPQSAAICTTVSGSDAILLPINREPSNNVWIKVLPVPDPTLFSNLKGAIVSTEFANQKQLGPGSVFTAVYTPMFSAVPLEVSLEVSAVLDYSDSGISTQVVFLDPTTFFKIWNYNLPKENVNLKALIQIPSKDAFWTQIGQEWELLPRTHTTKEVEAKMSDMMRDIRVQPVYDVASMYETASIVVNMEKVFNQVTLAAASIIFFIIMIGVLNSLRMTIRERTQEIGTMRAIGMKRRHVRWAFILETQYITLSGWVVGILISFAVMWALSQITFGYDNALNMVMKDRHLLFLPTWQSIGFNLILLLLFAFVTAWFPANRAAKLKPATAFSHVE